MTRTCSDCPAPISKGSKSGRCRSCSAFARAPRTFNLSPEKREAAAERVRRLNADPVINAKRVANLIARKSDPEVIARHTQACRESIARRRADPVKFARMQEIGREIGARNIGNLASPEARAKAVAAIRRAHLAWCPEEHWPLNQQLKRAGYPLEERKAMIRELIPGTVEHARREVQNNILKQRLRHERRQMEAY